MEFIKGLICIEEIIRFSTVGSLLALLAIIICIAMIVGGAKVAINSQYCEHEIAVRITGIALFVIGLIAAIAVSIAVNQNSICKILKNTNLTVKTGEYRVVATNETDMNDFVDKYEILDYKDGVYTIKAK